MPQFPKKDLKELIPTAPSEAIDLIESMLQVNPQKRPTALQCLQHPYFKIEGDGKE
jgi:serine/threonine protein kinase